MQGMSWSDTIDLIANAENQPLSARNAAMRELSWSRMLEGNRELSSMISQIPQSFRDAGRGLDDDELWDLYNKYKSGLHSQYMLGEGKVFEHEAKALKDIEAIAKTKMMMGMANQGQQQAAPEPVYGGGVGWRQAVSPWQEALGIPIEKSAGPPQLYAREEDVPGGSVGSYESGGKTMFLGSRKPSESLVKNKLSDFVSNRLPNMPDEDLQTFAVNYQGTPLGQVIQGELAKRGAGAEKQAAMQAENKKAIQQYDDMLLEGVVTGKIDPVIAEKMSQRKRQELGIADMGMQQAGGMGVPGVGFGEFVPPKPPESPEQKYEKDIEGVTAINSLIENKKISPSKAFILVFDKVNKEQLQNIFFNKELISGYGEDKKLTELVDRYETSSRKDYGIQEPSISEPQPHGSVVAGVREWRDVVEGIGRGLKDPKRREELGKGISIFGMSSMPPALKRETKGMLDDELLELEEILKNMGMEIISGWAKSPETVRTIISAIRKNRGAAKGR